MARGTGAGVVASNVFSSAESLSDRVEIADGLWARRSAGRMALDGEVDLNTEQALRLAVSRHARQEPGSFVLDLTGLGFLDSAGIGALYAMAKDPDMDFSISVRDGSMVDRLLTFSGLERIVAVERVAADG